MSDTVPDKLYIDIVVPADMANSVFDLIAVIYFIVGILTALVLTFSALIFVNHLNHKRNIYSIFKTLMWYEIIISIHMAKSGFINLFKSSNRLVCKFDSGFTIFAITLVSYFYLFLMIMLTYTRGNFPRITSNQRKILNLPAVLVGLISVVLIFKYELSGMSKWFTCFVDETQTQLVFLILFFIPTLTLVLISIIFTVLVILQYIELKGIFKGFHWYCLINSICLGGVISNFYIPTYWLGCICLIGINVNIIIFRLNCEVLKHVFDNNKITDNKIIFFFVILLGIESPPIDSELIDIQKDQENVIKAIRGETIKNKVSLKEFKN